MKLWEWTRICIDYMVGLTIVSSDVIRHGITNTCFLRTIKYDIKHKHNILIIQGGIHHFSNQTPHYIKLFASLPINSNIFHLERSDACVHIQNQCSDISSAINYINQHFNNNITSNIVVNNNNVNDDNYPLTVIGFSMGGACLLSYIASCTCNNINNNNIINKNVNYITVCSPLNFKHLFNIVNKEPLFKWLYQNQLKQYAVSDMNKLCQRYNTTVDYVVDEYKSRLKSLNVEHDKLICLVGNQDVITMSIKSDIQELQFKYQIVNMTHATHCCDTAIHTLHKIVSKHVDTKLPLTTIVNHL